MLLIAVIERFIRSLKDECTCQILVPLNFNDARNELALYSIWYNEFRPQETLDGRTPLEVYDNSPPCPEPACGELDEIPEPAEWVERVEWAKLKFAIKPNSKLPEMELHASFLKGRRGNH